MLVSIHSHSYVSFRVGFYTTPEMVAYKMPVCVRLPVPARQTETRTGRPPYISGLTLIY